MDAEIRKKILGLLDQHRIMTIATLRLYFLCGLDSQKAANIARDAAPRIATGPYPPISSAECAGGCRKRRKRQRRRARGTSLIGARVDEKGRPISPASPAP